MGPESLDQVVHALHRRVVQQDDPHGRAERRMEPVLFRFAAPGPVVEDLLRDLKRFLRWRSGVSV